jgi:hypothetical protein
MQTRVLIILILAGLLCGFVMYQTNVGGPTFAIVMPTLRIEKIVWTPNTGFTLYVDSNFYANVTQILVNDVSQNVTSPKLPCTLNPTLDPAFVVTFAYTNGTNYDISVVESNRPYYASVYSFQGGTNWTVPPPPPPPYYTPLVTVGLVAILVESFSLSALCTVQTKRTKHLIIKLVIVVILAWAVASVFVFIYFQPPLTFA